MDVDIYRVELRGREYIAVREKTAGRPLTRVFSNSGKTPKATVRRIREAIEKANDVA